MKLNSLATKFAGKPHLEEISFLISAPAKVTSADARQCLYLKVKILEWGCRHGVVSCLGM